MILFRCKPESVKLVETKGGGFEKLTTTCPYCQRLSSSSSGKFKDGASRKTKYGCKHFQGIETKVLKESDMNPVEKHYWKTERAFLFPYKAEEPKKMIFVFKEKE